MCQGRSRQTPDSALTTDAELSFRLTPFEDDKAMLNAFRPSVSAAHSALRHLRSFRWLSTSVALAAKRMPPRPTVNEADLEEAFLKGSGPGGQKIVCSVSRDDGLDSAEHFPRLRTKPRPPYS